MLKSKIELLEKRLSEIVANFEKEKELLELLQEFFPNSKLKIWNGNLIVR